MLNLQQARELTKKVVDQRGRDFVYNTQDSKSSCFYAPRPHAEEDDPKRTCGCIAGEVLTAHGETRHVTYSGSVDLMAQDFPDMMTLGAIMYLKAAQVVQDQRGRTWGEALDEAEAMVDNLPAGADNLTWWGHPITPAVE